ncbi:MAG: DinB family protein [Vicinamibacterales bacterium]
MTPQEARAAAKVIGTQLQHEWMTTAKVIAAIPEANKEWKPDPKSRSAWDLAVHLAGADIWFLTSILHGKFAGDPEAENRLKAAAPTPARLAEWYKHEFPKALEQVLAMPDHKFTDVIEFHGMKNPAIVYLNFALVHGVHHRGQLAGYLRPMGGKVPGIYGGSADEVWQGPTE